MCEIRIYICGDRGRSCGIYNRVRRRKERSNGAYHKDLNRKDKKGRKQGKIEVLRIIERIFAILLTNKVICGKMYAVGGSEVAHSSPKTNCGVCGQTHIRVSEYIPRKAFSR